MSGRVVCLLLLASTNAVRQKFSDFNADEQYPGNGGMNGGYNNGGMNGGYNNGMQPGMNGGGGMQGGYNGGMQPGMHGGGMQGGGGRFGAYSLPQRLASSFMLATGPNGVPLCPQLQPQDNEHIVLMNREKVGVVERNEYTWFMFNVPIATLAGSWTSNSFGHQNIHVRDMTGRELFMIRNSKNVWNPFAMRLSYRIHPPQNKDVAATWYTINKDIIGTGLLGMKEEWWIWYGRERDNRLAYYCVGTYSGWDYKFYRTKEDYEASRPPLAHIEQEMNAGGIIEGSQDWLPDNFRLIAGPGADSALLLAVSTVMDVAHDSQERADAN